MNSEKIYDALTDVREEFIEEAMERKLRKSPRRNLVVRWYAVAASLMIVVGIGSYIFMNIGGNSGAPSVPGASTVGGGRDSGSTTFMSYAGPVFTLSVLGDADGINASRDITFDFGGFGLTGTDENAHFSDVTVTDSYILTNDTGSGKSVEILYPFAGSFIDLHRLRPVITAGENALDAKLTAGPYRGGFSGIEGIEDERVNLNQINSWEDYFALLSDGEYLRHTLGERTPLDQTVIVYRFSNARGNHDESVAPTLAASFDLDYERTRVLTYLFNGASFDYENGSMRRSFFVPRDGFPEYGRSYYMIVVGDDISNLTVQGYENGGCYEGDEVDHVSVDVTRSETVLGDVFALLLDEFMDVHSGRRYTGFDYYGSDLDMAMLYRASAELFLSHGATSYSPAFRYHTGEMTDIFYETLVMGRLFYLGAEIDIPADGSVTINAVMVKQGSFDFFGSGSENTGVCGYDMLTRAGSNLPFSGMTAGLASFEGIEIVKQNFGFDPEKGIMTVILDLDQPHYYLEVRGLEPGE